MLFTQDRLFKRQSCAIVMIGIYVTCKKWIKDFTRFVSTEDIIITNCIIHITNHQKQGKLKSSCVNTLNCKNDYYVKDEWF